MKKIIQYALKLAEKFYNKKAVIKRIKSENNYVFLLNFGDSKKIIKIEKSIGDESWRLKKEVYLISKLKKTIIPLPSIEHYDFSGKIIPNPWIIMERMGDKDLNKLFTTKNNSEIKDLFRELGRYLAEIHKINFDKQGFIFHDSIEEEVFKDYINNSWKNAGEKLVKSGKIEREILDKAERIILKFRDSNECKLCHNDFGSWQAIIRDKKISAIIDWELARSSDPVYDYAKSELMLSIWSGNVKEFREGYEEVNKLPLDYEKISIPYKVLESLKIMAFFIENKSNFNKAKKMLLKLLKN